MQTLGAVLGDLCGSRRGCMSSGSADFRAISRDTFADSGRREIFRPRKIFEISVRNSLRIARKLTRRSMPTPGTVFGDLHASWQCLHSSSNADFHAISRDSGREIFRPRKFFENFGPKSAANRTKSHAPHHADARHSVRGPSCLAARLGVVGQSGFRRDLARSRTQHFAAAKIFRNFRSEIR